MATFLHVALLASLDVSFVPTPSSAAQQALQWAGVGADDIVYELGCGDGSVAAEAVKLGASAVCVEKDPDLAAQALERMLSVAGDQPQRVKVLTEDLFEVNMTEATVVYVFLLPDLNARLRPALTAQLQPGARVVSAEFQSAPLRALEPQARAPGAWLHALTTKACVGLASARQSWAGHAARGCGPRAASSTSGRCRWPRHHNIT